jgi:lysophospholipase L1-like esterase
VPPAKRLIGHYSSRGWKVFRLDHWRIMSIGPRSRPLNVVIGAVATVVMAAVWSVSASTTAGAAAVQVPAGSKYVAIGSSYAAGQSIATQIGVCGRSTNNYPHLVAKALHLKLTDVTCGAAVTANAINTPQGDQPPQVDAVTKSTKLVTITMGGNDVQYSPTALACGADSAACLTAQSPMQLNSEFAALPGALTTLIEMVRSRAPETKIVFVPYVRIVPTVTCPALNFSPAAANYVGRIGMRLEKVFVDVVKKTGVLMADPYAAGSGHGPCAGSQAWIAGHQAINGFPYHPTAAGHVAMAHLVEHALRAG